MIPYSTRCLLTGGMAFLLSASALAADQESTPPALEQLTINGQDVMAESVREVELQGPVYEVRLRNGETFYSDAAGRHMVVGRLYDNSPSGLVDVTEQNDRQERLDQLNAIPEGGTVAYAAQGGQQGEIYVFTDTTCPYCTELHQEIDELTAAGIAVTYVPFPRAGSGSPAARQLAQVMCSQSPQDAMTVAFEGRPLEVDPAESCRSAVNDGVLLGQRFGVEGTPTIVLPTGEVGEGYVPANQLIQAITSSNQ